MRQHAAILTLLTILVVMTAASPLPAAEWRVENLGVPIKAVTYGNSHAVLASGPGGKGTMFYTSYYCSTGCELVGFDFRSGQSLRKKLPSNGGYAVTLGGDGAIYVGGVVPGDLYRYDPKSDQLATIDVKKFGTQYIWDAAVGKDGTIYCAAGFPQARLVAYSPKDGAVNDLGVLVPGEEYLRSICVDAKGKVWCGIGMHAHLIVYDPATGEKAEVLPTEFRRNSSVYSLASIGDYVVASVFYDGRLLIYDAAGRNIVRTVPRPEGDQSWIVAAGSTGSTAYLYALPSQTVYRCDLRDGSLTRLVQGVGQVHVVEADRFLHATEDQCYVVYDLQQRREIARRKLTEGGDGMDIFALTAGPDGHIYGSTYINMHMFRCEADSGRLTDLGKVSRWPGQVDSLSLGRDGRIYIGAYIDAVLSVYEPGKSLHPGTQPADNPREIGPIGKGQYRTRANCLGPDGKLYVGSIPAYNSAPTGAFTICDPNTASMDVRTDLVRGGTVDCLVSDERFVYGSGGGEFFAYDPANGKKQFRIGRRATALAALPGGKVIGSAAGKIFIYDRQANEITLERPNPVGDFTDMAVAPDGSAFGVNATNVARVAADGGSEILLHLGGQFAAVDRQGRLYFARGPQLLRCSPQ